jgi:hypothetical protein
MSKAKFAYLVFVMTFISLPLFAPPGGGGGGGGAPIDGGATIFLGAVAAYAYKKLRKKGE